MLEIFHVYLFFGLFGYIYSLKILPKEQGDFAEVSKASHLGWGMWTPIVDSGVRAAQVESHFSSGCSLGADGEPGSEWPQAFQKGDLQHVQHWKKSLTKFTKIVTNTKYFYETVNIVGNTMSWIQKIDAEFPTLVKNGWGASIRPKSISISRSREKLEEHWHLEERAGPGYVLSFTLSAAGTAQ